MSDIKKNTEDTHPPTEPSFFPIPENPPLSSTPAQNPVFPSISPKYLSEPSNPNDSILTLSPTSKARPTRLELLNTSDCRLNGRTPVGVFDLSAGLRNGVCPAADEGEATEGGRPVTERLPDWNESAV